MISIVARVHDFPYNFRQLILGKSFLNIADSFYAIAVSVGLGAGYHITAGSLSTFTLVALLPAMFGFLFGHAIDRIEHKKNWLVACQSIYVVLVVLIAACLYMRVPVAVLCMVNFLFYCVSTVIGALDTSIVPQALDDDEDLIEKSVDIQYFTGNILNIASNFCSIITSWRGYVFRCAQCEHSVLCGGDFFLLEDENFSYANRQKI